MRNISQPSVVWPPLTLLLCGWCSAALGADAATKPAQTTTPPAGAPLEILHQRPDRLMVRLRNRLVVIVQEIHTSPVVSVQAWVRTGSIYEQELTGFGLSHYLEHLVSGGTTATRTEQQSGAILGQIGGRTNAGTGLQTVQYYINTTSAHAQTAIELLSDWLQNSMIVDKEFAREREVIQREFEQGRGSPGRVFWKLTQQARYQLHPARHPIIGYVDDFLGITRNQVYDFYKRMYVPNNMVFVVVGDVDQQQVLNQIGDLWANVAPQPIPRFTLPIESESASPRQLSATASVTKPRLRLAWPGTKVAGRFDYELDLLGVVLGNGESSRLVRIVRDEKRLVNRISAYNLSFPWGKGFFSVDCEVAVPDKPAADGDINTQRQQAIDEAAGAIIAQIKLVKAQGVTEEELARAKRQMLAQAVYRSQTVQAIGSRLASDMLTMGDPDYRDRWVRAIGQITLRGVQAAAAEVLDMNRLITVTLLPQPKGAKATPLVRPPDKPVPEGTKFESIVLDNTVSIGKFKALAASGTPAAKALEIGPIQRHVLPNGLRLLVQRSTLVPAVSIQLFRPGGLLADTPGNEGVANAAAVMVTKGTKTRTAQQIDQQIESLGASLGSRAGRNTFHTSAVCLRDDWPTVLELFADVTLNPTFPDDEWEKMQRLILARIDRRNDRWHGELNNHFKQAYFGDQHPWSQINAGRRKVMEKVTAEDLRRFHQEHLGAAQAVLAVFGDVDPSQVVAKVQAYFAPMPKQVPVPFDPLVPTAPVEALHLTTTAKELAAVQIGYGPGVTVKSPDFAAVQVLVDVLGDFPAGWLTQELRGKGRGLAYAVWAYSVSGVVPGYFAVVFNTTPDSIPEALSRASAVIERAVSRQVDPQTLARAKASVLADEFLGQQSNANRAIRAALDELYERGEDASQRFLRQVREVTPQKLQEVAQTYLRNPVIVVMSHQPLVKQQLIDAAKPKAQSAEEPESK